VTDVYARLQSERGANVLKVSKSLAFSWFLKQAKPVIGLHGANVILILGGSILALADPLILKWLIDTVLPSGNLHSLILCICCFTVAYLARLVLNYGETLVTAVSIQKMVFRVRLGLLRKLHSFSSQYHDDSSIGDILHRLSNDVETISELGSDILPIFLRMTATGIAVLIVMAILNLQLTCLVLPLLPLYYFLRKHFWFKLKEASDRAQYHNGGMSSFLQEHLSGIIQLRLLNQTGPETSRFARLASNNAALHFRSKVAEVKAGAVSMGIIVAASAAILSYGGYEVTQHRLTVGGLVAFYSYVARLFDSVSSAGQLQHRLARVNTSIRRLMEVEQTPAEHVTVSGSKARFPNHNYLEFSEVSFRYRPDRTLLEGITFRIDPGEKVALVGVSGSGKTTIGRLATRLYDPTEGAITIGGQSIRDIGIRSLRARVTVVPQDPILFSGTLRSNLLLGNAYASLRDLERVCELAQLQELVCRLKGLDQDLGPRCTRLSGGERKRVALARAMLQEPRVLILDEITSALDGPNETAVLDGLAAFATDRVLLIISHRPSTIAWASRTLVLEQGRISAQGTHHQLTLTSVLYRNICMGTDKSAGFATV
jgi:ABC-type multidrug transport system fused ATPase/permease subunit